jgi:YegS/Rv2252/BmrU family lipid kinase
MWQKQLLLSCLKMRTSSDTVSVDRHDRTVVAYILKVGGTMKKIYFIFNLMAGKAVIGDMLGDIIDRFTKAGYEVTARPTQENGDAVQAAEYACESNFDMIVCAGGDGTLSQCIHGVMNSENRIPIGYIPAGSTNDFAKGLGIPKGIMESVQWIIDGTPMPCDVGSFNDGYFTYIVAFGAFTNVTYETSQQIKNIFGHAAYIVSGLTHLTSLRSKRMRIEYNDTVLEDDFIFGMVTNSSSVAGLLSLNDFLLDDGQFEVTLIKKPSNLVQLQKIIRSLLNIKEEIDKDYIRFFRTDSITFTALSDEPITWTLDGEYGGDSVVNKVTNNRKAVSFIVGPQDDTNFAPDEYSEKE